MALLFSSFPPLACFAVTRGPRSGGCTDPLFPFHSVEHAHGLPQPHRTLLEYWAPLATHRLVFPPCTRQDQAHCFCRKSWIKQKCDRYGLPLRNYKKKPTFSTFCCFSLGICGSDFHCHEYLKTFAFLQSMFVSKVQNGNVNSLLIFKTGKKNCTPLKGKARCATKLTNGQTSSQVPRRHVHGAYSTRAGECGRKVGSVPRVQSQPLSRAPSGCSLAGQAREGWGSLGRSAFLLPALVNAAYLELQTVVKKCGVIYFIILREDGIFPQSIFSSDLFCLPLQDTSNILHSFHKKANRHQYRELFFSWKQAKCLLFFSNLSCYH